MIDEKVDKLPPSRKVPFITNSKHLDISLGF
jgi:hypothetical protein